MRVLGCGCLLKWIWLGVDDEILESLLPKDESVSTAAINDGGIGGSVERDGGEEEHVNVLVAFMMESWKCFLGEDFIWEVTHSLLYCASDMMEIGTSLD